MKRDGIRDKAYRSLVAYLSFISLLQQVEGEREVCWVKGVFGGEGRRG